MTVAAKIKKKILIVDDHPMIIVAYRKMLASSGLKEYDLDIDTAENIDEAIWRINEASSSVPYDLTFLDIKLPPSSDGKYVSGEDLAGLVREKLPKSRLVILTMFNESYRIYNILKKINPDGLLIKNDVNAKNFIQAFQTAIENPPYYSESVNKYFRKLGVETNPLDDVNRRIIYHLSNGVKTKNIGPLVDLTLSAIEKRKTQIKKIFNIENASDESLIAEAQKRGYV